jgi:MFS family permease
MTPVEAGAWPAPRVAWYTVAILMVAYVLSFLDRVILGLLVGPIRADLGISDTRVSLLYGFAFAIFYTGLGVPIAWWADRANRRNIVAAGVFLWSLMTAACGLARGFWQLFLARVGVGVGEATLSPAAYSMIADSFPEAQRARALSVFFVGLPAGVGLALVVGGQVVQAVSGAPEYVLPVVGSVRAWQVAFFVVGLPGVLVALWMLTVPEPLRRHAGAQAGIGDTFAWMRRHWRAYTAHVLGFSVLGLVLNTFQIWGPQHLVRVHGFPLARAGLAIGAMIGVLGTLGILAGGALADRLRACGHLDATLRVGLVAALALVPFGAACTLVGDATTMLVLFAPIAVFSCFAYGAGAAALTVLTPGPMRAQASAIYLLFVNLVGIGLGPLVTALLTDYAFGSDLAVGKSVAIVAGTAPALAAALFAWGLRPFRESVVGGAGALSPGRPPAWRRASPR